MSPQILTPNSVGPRESNQAPPCRILLEEINEMIPIWGDHMIAESEDIDYVMNAKCFHNPACMGAGKYHIRFHDKIIYGIFNHTNLKIS